MLGLNIEVPGFILHMPHLPKIVNSCELGGRVKDLKAGTRSEGRRHLIESVEGNCVIDYARDRFTSAVPRHLDFSMHPWLDRREHSLFIKEGRKTICVNKYE